MPPATGAKANAASGPFRPPVKIRAMTGHRHHRITVHNGDGDTGCGHGVRATGRVGRPKTASAGRAAINSPTRDSRLVPLNRAAAHRANRAKPQSRCHRARRCSCAGSFRFRGRVWADDLGEAFKREYGSVGALGWGSPKQESSREDTPPQRRSQLYSWGHALLFWVVNRHAPSKAL